MKWSAYPLAGTPESQARKVNNISVVAQEEKITSFFSLKKAFAFLFWPLLLVFLYLLSFCGWVALYGLQPGPPIVHNSVVVNIPKGAGVRRIGDLLANSGLVHRDFRFHLVARAMGIASRLPAGEFELTAGQNPVDLLRQLAVAKPYNHVVTIPEGLRARDIGEIITAMGLGSRERFLDLVSDPSFIRTLKLENLSSLEGYLFPDTYHLKRVDGIEEKLIRRMVDRFQAVYGRMVAGYNGKLSRHEIVTLASIIEKETGKPEEQSTIAAVFLNRLKRKMRLQSDPTVIYGLERFSGNLTKKDLRTNTPYNTYTNGGLPAGPICNPGSGALKAVFSPAEANFLYFVSKNDGSHHFSKSLQEHNRAVYKYQRKKRKN